MGTGKLVEVEPRSVAMCKVIQSVDARDIEQKHQFIANLVKKYGGINHGSPFSTQLVHNGLMITMIIFFDLPKENLESFQKDYNLTQFVHS
jgi:hypothetical protein